MGPARIAASPTVRPPPGRSRLRHGAAFWSTGTFARCYETNRRASITTRRRRPVAACVQEIMATRSAWTGSGTDLLRAAAGLTGDGSPRGTPAGPNIHARSPAAFAGLRPSCGLCASTLPAVVKAAPGIGHPDACDPRKYRRHRQQRARGWVAIRRRTTCVAALLVFDLNHGPGLVEPCPTGHDFLAATDEADGADFL